MSSRLLKTILLTKGKVALVDDEDYVWLSQWKWCAHKCVYKTRVVWYAKRGLGFKYDKRTIFMHQEVAGVIGILKVDHRDGDGLNNQRNNLRPATTRQNGHNRRKSSFERQTSQFKGVYWNKRDGRWMASITVEGRKWFLGYFDEEQDAAKAYDKAAKQAFGEFALLNFNDAGA